MGGFVRRAILGEPQSPRGDPTMSQSPPRRRLLAALGVAAVTSVALIALDRRRTRPSPRSRRSGTSSSRSSRSTTSTASSSRRPVQLLRAHQRHARRRRGVPRHAPQAAARQAWPTPQHRDGRRRRPDRRTPLLSAAFHDEPTIEAMNQMGLSRQRRQPRVRRGLARAAADAERRLPDDGPGVNNQNSCPGQRLRRCADFQYLAANVPTSDPARRSCRRQDQEGPRRQGRLHRHDSRGHAEHRDRLGVAGLEFGDEVETANALVPSSTARREVHRGAAARGRPPETRRLQRLRRHLRARSRHRQEPQPGHRRVINGHTHPAYNCTINDPAGNPRLVTSASSFGRLVTEIDLNIDPAPATSSAPRRTPTT